MPKDFAHGIADILLKNKAIDKDTAQALKKDFKGRSKEAIDDFLLEEGLVTKEDLLAALSEYYNVPAFDVEGYFFDHMLLRQFPKDFLLRNMIIPVAVFAGDNILSVVCNDPSDEELLPKIGQLVSYDLDLLVGIAPRITDQVKEFYDESLTISDDYDYVPAQEEDEKIALEIAKRRIDRST